jgi:hypothetical protein
VVKTGVLAPENGTAYEGRRTDLANGSDSLYFDLVDSFLHDSSQPVEIKVTYLDKGSGSFSLQYASQSGARNTAPVTLANSNAKKTATFRIQDGRFDGSLTGGTDFRLVASGGDIEITFVRVISSKSSAQRR